MSAWLFQDVMEQAWEVDVEETLRLGFSDHARTAV